MNEKTKDFALKSGARRLGRVKSEMNAVQRFFQTFDLLQFLPEDINERIETVKTTIDDLQDICEGLLESSTLDDDSEDV